MADLAAFLERVPAEYVLADPGDLDGRVIAADDAADAPLGESAPEERARELLSDASELELLTPVVSPAYVDAIQEHVLGGTRIDVVATGEARQALLSGPLAAVQPMLAAKPHVTLHVHDGEAPFAVLLRPERVAFALADDDGAIEILYESEGGAARAWARDVFDVYRAEADPLQ